MASGPISAGDGAKERQSYTVTKVYRRKTFKGQKKKVPSPKSATVTDEPTSAAPENVHNDSRAAATNENDNKNDVAHVINSNDDKNNCNKDDNSLQPPAPEQEVQLETVIPKDVTQPEQQAEQQKLSSLQDVVSEDSSSLNQQQVSVLTAQEPGNVSIKQGLKGRVKINLIPVSGSKPKEEKRGLRRKLENQLHMVRTLVKRIEVKEGTIGGGSSHSHASANEGVDNVANTVNSEVASAGYISREIARPSSHLSASVLENSQGVMNGNVEKEKRTPKANPYYQNSEFLLAKDKFPPAESNKKSKLNVKKHGGTGLGNGFGMGAKFSKSCSSLLERLLKHKHGWVFKAPVDAKALMLR